MMGIWEMILKGGIMMVPLILTSIIGLAVVIERAYFLRSRRIIRPELVDLINHIEKLKDVEKIVENLSDNSSPFLNIVRVALKNQERPRDEIKEAIIDQGRQEARVLERGLTTLETVAGISPLLGLLGTVLGMIKVFNVITVQGLGQTQSLSGGISEALITTVVGLSIAIPALIAYNYFNRKVEELVLEIEKYSNQLLEKIGNVHRNRKRKNG